MLEPVHGRSIFHAMLVGSQRSIWRVVRFGTAVTVSHIFTAFLIALLAYIIGDRIGFDQLTFGGQIFGIALSAGFGIAMLVSAIRKSRKAVVIDDCHCVCHTVEHELEHAEHYHEHEVEEHPKEHNHHACEQEYDRALSPTWLGISGGIIPCSASIATLFLAIGSGKIAYGFYAIVVFGLGLGLTLTLAGSITALAAGKMSFFENPRYVKWMRFAPGVVVTTMAVVSLILLLSGAETH